MLRAILGSMMCLGFACAVFAGDANTPGGGQRPQLTPEQQTVLNDANQVFQSVQPQIQAALQTPEVVAAREAYDKAIRDAISKDPAGKEALGKIDDLKAKLPENLRGVVDNQLRGGGAGFTGPGGWSIQPGAGGGWSIQPGAGFGFGPGGNPPPPGGPGFAPGGNQPPGGAATGGGNNNRPNRGGGGSGAGGGGGPRGGGAGGNN